MLAALCKLRWTFAPRGCVDDYVYVSEMCFYVYVCPDSSRRFESITKSRIGAFQKLYVVIIVVIVKRFELWKAL